MSHSFPVHSFWFCLSLSLSAKAYSMKNTNNVVLFLRKHQERQLPYNLGILHMKRTQIYQRQQQQKIHDELKLFTKI